MRRIVKKSTTEAELKHYNANKFVLENFLFDKQLAFVNDPEPFKTAVCSRRAGKTISCAAHLIDTAQKSKGVICIYITLSRNNAKKLVWRELKKITSDHNLAVAIDETELTMSFANDSIIYVTGAKDAGEIEKFRGLPIKLCYIDECQSFREYIKELIDDIIAPALIDHAGSLCLIGTPGPIPTGYFHECSVKSNTWSKHAWTFFDNPHIATKSNTTHQKLLERELKRRGVEVNHPSIQREWFGRWTLDSDSLLLKYDQTKNHFSSLPVTHKKWQYVLGVDIGFKDADALAVLGWTEDGPETFLIEEVVTVKQGITELVDQINKLRAKYDIHKIVMDMGGLGKKIGEEMIRRYLIPVEPAEKARKMENIELLNDSLRTGRFKALHNSRFAQDTYLVEIDRDKSKPDRIVVSNRYHSDIIDAVLYAFKLSPAYAWEPPKKAPAVGTKEWADAQTDSMWEATLEEAKSADSYTKWLNGEES